MAKKRKDNCWWKSDRWFFILWVNGRRLTFKGFTDFDATRRMKDDLQVQIARHAARLPVQPTVVCPLMHEHLVRLKLLPRMMTATLPALVAQYIEQTDSHNPDHRERQKTRLLRVINDQGWRTVQDIDASHLPGYFNRLKNDRHKTIKDASASTRRAYVISIRSFGKWLEQEEIVEANPFRRLKVPKVRDEQRVIVRRVLTPDERQRLLIATLTREPKGGWLPQLPNADRAMLYAVALGTGLRASELAALKPANFDLGRAVLRFRKSKGGKKAALPLPPSLVPTLFQFLGGRDSERLLWPGGWPRKASVMIRGDLEAAGIAYVVNGEQADFHSLRHTFNTALAEAGVEPSARQLLTRHRDLAMVENYTHLPRAVAVAAIARLELPTFTLPGGV